MSSRSPHLGPEMFDDTFNQRPVLQIGHLEGKRQYRAALWVMWYLVYVESVPSGYLGSGCFDLDYSSLNLSLEKPATPLNNSKP